MSGGQPPTARQYTEHSHCPVCEEFRSDLAKSDAALAAAAEQLREVMEELKLANKRLAAAESVLREIVCTEPPDDGVVLLSNEGTCHLNTERNCQEYDHVHFSPLGDALMKLYRTLKGELPPGLELVRIGCREENHRLKKEADFMRDKIAGLESQNAALQKQLSDQADEISMLNAEAEMWQQRAEMAEREAVRVNERLAAAERLLIETYKQAGNSAPAERRHALTAQLRDNMRDYIKANCAVAAGWLPHPAEAEQLEGGG